MVKTVTSAFNLYRRTYVDLEPSIVDIAKGSRDYLVGQIKHVAATDDTFPALYDNGWFLAYGSFARKTKVQPLDDIDLLHVLHACGGTSIYLGINSYAIRIENQTLPLWSFTDNGLVNSTKILNKFKSALMGVSNYKNTEINKRGEAVVVNLKSYPWSFDVVPGFAVSDGNDGVEHFLIPDGNGQWKKTDPRRDQTFVSRVNTLHNGHILPLIRVIKYWNQYSRHAERLGSYHLETLLLNGFAARQPLHSVKSGVPIAFRILESSILSTCPDPKGLGPALDKDMDLLKKISFSVTTKLMAERIELGEAYELFGLEKDAIKQWQSVFPDFPAYEE